jgi:hypothetical protein
MTINNITVFTDASYCHQTGAAAGAVWARGDGEHRVCKSFPLHDVKGSGPAELLTTLLGMQAVIQDPILSKELRKGPKTRLVLVTDHLLTPHTFNGINRKLLNENPPIQCLFTEMTGIVERWRFWLKINHVKAHDGTETPRKWVNNWCDRKAREVMREQRALKLKDQEIV